jgi:hypothetical protein
VSDRVQSFTPFNPNIQQHYLPSLAGSEWVYSILLKYDKYKILHVYGDTDALVSVHGAFKWLLSQNYRETLEWTPITKDNGLVGYYKEYGKLSMMTVHGEGHNAIYTRVADYYDFLIANL